MRIQQQHRNERIHCLYENVTELLNYHRRRTHLNGPNDRPKMMHFISCDCWSLTQFICLKCSMITIHKVHLLMLILWHFTQFKLQQISKMFRNLEFSAHGLGMRGKRQMLRNVSLELTDFKIGSQWRRAFKEFHDIRKSILMSFLHVTNDFLYQNQMVLINFQILSTNYWPNNSYKLILIAWIQVTPSNFFHTGLKLLHIKRVRQKESK